MNELQTPQTPGQATEAKAPDGLYVWVCPNCGSTWHSSAVGHDLNVIPNLRSAMSNLATEDPSEWGSVVGYRSNCQQCKDSREAQANRGPFQRERVLYVKASRVEAG